MLKQKMILILAATEILVVGAKRRAIDEIANHSLRSWTSIGFFKFSINQENEQDSRQQPCPY